MSPDSLLNRPPIRSNLGGFTLIEILVVLVIIGVMASAAVLALGSVKGDRGLVNYTKALQNALGNIQQRAQLSAKTLAVINHEEGFEVLEYHQGSWHRKVRLSRILPALKTTKAEINGRLINVDEQERQALILYGNGELSPVDIVLSDRHNNHQQLLAKKPGTFQIKGEGS